MFALFYNALLRFFGFGSPAKVPQTMTTGGPSPVWDNWLKQAKERKAATPVSPFANAVATLAQKAGQRPASEAAPSDRLVKAAEAIVGPDVCRYLGLLAMLGLAFPRLQKGGDAKAFERKLRHAALHDVTTWLLGLYSAKPIQLPEEVTDVLIQRAANQLGQDEPYLAPFEADPDFIAYAETQSHVVQTSTGFCVFPRVVVRGQNTLVEVTGTSKRFHRETARLSGWEFRTRYLGPVIETPAIRIEDGDADQVSINLTPKDDPIK